MAAAAAAGRRVVILVDRRSVTDASPPWTLLPEEVCALEPAPVVVTHPPNDPAGAAQELARVLGAPDTLLAMLPATALAAIAGGSFSSDIIAAGAAAGAAGGAAGTAAGLDLAGLAGVTTLRLPDLASSAAASSGVGSALAEVLTRHTCTLKTLQLPGCHPKLAAVIAPAALACHSLVSLSFGGLVLPVGAIRRSVAGGLTDLDLTAGVSGGSAHRGGAGGLLVSNSSGGDGGGRSGDGEIVAVSGNSDAGDGGEGVSGSGGRAAGGTPSSSSDGGIGDAELASLAAMLGGRWDGGDAAFSDGAHCDDNDANTGHGAKGGFGRAVSSLALPPWLPASTVQRVVEAIGCAALPSINGVPATVGARDATVDLTGVTCGVPGVLALTVGAVTAVY